MTTVSLLQAFPDGRRALPAAVPARAGRRVPGHQPRAVRAGPRARRHPAARRTRSPPGRSWCVVGDADQSIYAFRGASIRNILEFEQDYPDATTILLEQNYRSTQTILTAANAVIARNPDRKPKNLWSDAGDGAQIVGYVADNEHDEAAFVAGEIDRLSDDRGRAARRRRGLLPHQRAVPGVRGGVHPGRPAVQGGRRGALLRAARGPRRAGLPAADRQHRPTWSACAGSSTPRARHRRPGRGVRRGAGRSGSGSRSATALERADEAPGIATALGRRDQRTSSTLMTELRAVAAGEGNGPAAVLEAVLDRTGYLRRARGQRRPAGRVPGGEPPRAGRGGPGVRASRATPDGRRLEDFLEQVSLVADADAIPDADGNGGVVTLMTLHTAKGLEFPVVFLTGMEDGVFPHLRSLGDPQELAEERRLAYVGITRARRAAVRVPGRGPVGLGAAVVQPGVPVPRRDAGGADRLGAVRAAPAAAGPGQGGGDRAGPRHAQGRRRQPADPRARPRRQGQPRRVRARHGGCGPRRGEKAQAQIDFGADIGPKWLLLRYAPLEKL